MTAMDAGPRAARLTATALALAVVLAACGPGGPGEAPPPTAAGRSLSRGVSPPADWATGLSVPWGLVMPRTAAGSCPSGTAGECCISRRTGK